MDPESKKLLEDTLELEQENNKILRSMKRSLFWSRIMTGLYWLIIIGISVGAFYFLQPYFNRISSLYNSIFSGTQQKVEGSSNSFQNFLKKL
jgi:hypothetical protein